MITPLSHQQGNKALAESGLVEKEWVEVGKSRRKKSVLNMNI